MIGKLMAKYPGNLCGHYVPHMFRVAYPEICERGVIYVDTWPVSPPMLTVFHPDMMSQFTVEQSQPKHDHLHR